jgi:hypothetical protein
MNRQGFPLVPLEVGSLVESIKLVEDYEYVGHKEGEINLVDATLCLVRANAIEKNECKLHLKIAKNTHTSCGKGFNYYAQKTSSKSMNLLSF